MDNLTPTLQQIFSSGEVLHPDTPNINPLFQRHVAGYRFCADFCEGKVVLDVGSGEGYGSNFLAEKAKELTALEYTQALVDYAKERYKRPHLTFVQGDATKLPFDDARFEVVTNLQLIEHFPDYPAFIREAYRVLKPGGVMVTVTPNPRTMLAGVNPYHYKEFDPFELGQAMEATFDRVDVMGLFGSERYMALKEREQAFARKILAWDVFNLRRFIPRQVIAIPYRWAFLAVNKNTERNQDEVGAEISPDDFFIGTSHLESALESIAVARKKDA